MSIDNSELYNRVCRMEKELAVASDLLSGIAFIAETLEAEQACVVQRMAWIAGDHCQKAEKIRGELFRMTHPQRERFGKEGWPS